MPAHIQRRVLYSHSSIRPFVWMQRVPTWLPLAHLSLRGNWKRNHEARLKWASHSRNVPAGTFAGKEMKPESVARIEDHTKLNSTNRNMLSMRWWTKILALGLNDINNLPIEPGKNLQGESAASSLDLIIDTSLVLEGRASHLLFRNT